MDVNNTLGKMTTVEKFHENVISALKYLDTILPNGSHVLFIGIVDGRILWDEMHNRTHPLGVTYAKVYEWLLCLKANPCVAWLNPDKNLRDAASQRAAELSQQYELIIKNTSFQNFDMAYYPFPLKELIEEWKAQGGDVSALIEPVDGFHPSQQLNSLLGKYIFQLLLKDHPTFVGAVNPFNDQIKKVFGDQGGY